MFNRLEMIWTFLHHSLSYWIYWVYCWHKGIYTVSNNIQVGSGIVGCNTSHFTFQLALQWFITYLSSRWIEKEGGQNLTNMCLSSCTHCYRISWFQFVCWEEEKGLHVLKSDHVDINFIYLFYTKGREHNGEAPAHQPDPDLPHVTNAVMSSRACSTAASISRCTFL